MQRISLLMGDDSNDGHGRTNLYYIQSNFSPTEIGNAYKLGVEKLGFDFIKEIAVKYDDSDLSKEIFDKLIEGGVAVPLDIDLNEDGSVFLDSDVYALFYLNIAKFGNKKLKFFPVNGRTNVIDIGGYGLFGG